MSAKGYIGVAEFGTVADNFDNVDWLALHNVSYKSATNQTTYKTTDKKQHQKIQQRLYAYPRVKMVTEDTKGTRTGPNRGKMRN